MANFEYYFNIKNLFDRFLIIHFLCDIVFLKGEAGRDYHKFP